MFVFILGGLLLGNIAWWLWADSKLRRARVRPRWRAALAVFNTIPIAYLLLFLAFPWWGHLAHHWVPPVILAGIYIWQIVVLPVTLAAIVVFELCRLVLRLRARRKRAFPEIHPAQAAVTRRQVIAAALVSAPPVLLGGGLVRGMSQLGHFRVRRLVIPLADLPAELDGLTIAHVSDIHVGRFTTPRMLPAIIEATNRLRCDLVAFTGDLIDLAIADLPYGIDAIHRLDPRRGFCMVEGNHDLIEAPRASNRAAGRPDCRCCSTRRPPSACGDAGCSSLG